MISPEVLRRYPFFGALADACLKEIAMLAEEVSYEPDQTLYDTGEAAFTLYLLLEGSVETYLVVGDPEYPGKKKEYYLGDVNPGDVFGMSAMVEPFKHTTMTRAGQACRVVALDGAGLHKLCADSPEVGYELMTQVARSALERLQSTRVQLAATRHG